MPSTGDLFTPIHKALRCMIYSLGARLQTNDFADVAATTQLVVDLENDFEVARSAGCILCVLSGHAVDEQSAIFPHVADFGPELVQSLIEEHHDLMRRELALARSAHDLLALGSPEARVSAGAALNLSANDLFAAYLAHMNREETHLVPLMREHFSDEEMNRMRGAIMGALPRERLFAILEWMLPSLNLTELTRMLSAMKVGLPPPSFGAMTELAAQRVDPDRWRMAKQRVGI